MQLRQVAEVLRAARARAGFDQRVLAKRSGLSRPTVTRYESGAVSPTVATLDRLLAACGLQARISLEPLLADVDARVDSLLAGAGVLDTDELPELMRTLEDDPEAAHGGFSRIRPQRRGPVPWAFDGATALLLHGLAVDEPATTLVVEWGDAARYWLLAIGAQGRDERGDAVGWRELPKEAAQVAVGRPFFTLRGILQLRLVDELPPATQLAVEWTDRAVPAVSVDEVEQHYPEHAEVLARLRVRRAQT
jgi:transcriptional regulator with XRE-family HTH domain